MINKDSAKINEYNLTFIENSILQKEVACRLLERLDYCKLIPERILDLGCGTGFTTKQLSKRYQNAYIYGLDISFDALKIMPRMNSLVKVCGDGINLPFASSSFDLIIANMLLHWVDNFDALLLECQRVLSNDGLLLFSTLGDDSFEELKFSWGAIDDSLCVHKYFDFIELGDHLQKTNWKDPVLDKEKLILQYNSFANIIGSLKINNISDSKKSKTQVLNIQQKVVELEKVYAKYKNSTGKFPVSFDIIYGHGLKKEIFFR